jgi:hypothetical protein
MDIASVVGESAANDRVDSATNANESSEHAASRNLNLDLLTMVNIPVVWKRAFEPMKRSLVIYARPA